MSPSSALIDELLPAWDVRERHAIHVSAPPAVVYDAIAETDFARPPLVRALLALRALPAVLARRAEPRPAPPALRLRDFEAHGFRLLAERAPRELVIGLEGRFWTAGGALCATSTEAFARPIAPGMARAAWDFTVRDEPGGSRLTTETRVRCADARARRRFLPYWALIRPFSGMIRTRMLREIRRTAEGRA